METPSVIRLEFSNYWLDNSHSLSCNFIPFGLFFKSADTGSRDNRFINVFYNVQTLQWLYKSAFDSVSTSRRSRKPWEKPSEWPKNKFHQDNYLHELRSICCQVSLIILNWRKLRKVEMNWDNVRRGYCHGGTAPQHEQNKQTAIYSTNQIYDDAHKTTSSVQRPTQEEASAECTSEWGKCKASPCGNNRFRFCAATKQNFISERKKENSNSHMMAMRELKLPMLKHSRATSMKNSMTRARCFFFPGC